MDTKRALNIAKAQAGIDTDKELKQATGFHNDTLAGIKNGSDKITIGTYKRLCDVCNISLTEFFSLAEGK
ncbi:helix-turn-helix family protein [uncultured Mediterranean phage uvMED]|nr:helix-turn-helix family protein [uncultured Mediterranean phage uvMED]